jgi:PPOX class probable F420-dependent enzyme
MAIDDLMRAPYVSFATFKRSGAMVATPVWCAEQDGDYFIFSAAEAGKVKRLRNSPRAQLAVCDARGKLGGEWHEAEAVLIEDGSEIDRALAALRKKYGWQMWLADTGSKLTGKFHKRSYIRTRLKTNT